MQYNFLTDAEVTDMIGNAGAVGFSIGLLVGILVVTGFAYLMIQQNRRSFKMWFLELSEDERVKVREHLEDVTDSLEELAKSNTRLFKRLHNDVCDIMTYLKKKWMQN